MDDFFYNAAYILIILQILANALFLIWASVVLAVPSLRSRGLADGKIVVLNEIAFAIFSLLVGLILLKFLLDGTAAPWLLFAGSILTSGLKEVVGYLYRKRVPAPELLETRNRYLPNTTAEAFCEEAQLLAEKESQPESTVDNDSNGAQGR